MPFKFVVGIDEEEYIANPEGFVSHDTCPQVMSIFLQKHLGLDYPAHFVSISVRFPVSTSDSKVGGDVQPKYSLADVYGRPFTLIDSTISHIDLVCSGDFQDRVCAALVALLEGKDLTRHKEYFKVVTGNSADEIRAAIEEAEEERNGFPYVEARIYRPLRREDCEDPDAGRREVGLFEMTPSPEDDDSDITF